MTDLRQAATLALDALELSAVTVDSFGVQKATQAAIAALRTALEQQAEQIGWAVQGCSKMWRGEFAEIDAKAEAKRIGGTCVAFALYTAQREWAGLTDEDWGWVADKKETSLDTFAHGAAWASDQLKERNNG